MKVGETQCTVLRDEVIVSNSSKLVPFSSSGRWTSATFVLSLLHLCSSSYSKSVHSSTVKDSRISVKRSKPPFKLSRRALCFSYAGWVCSIAHWALSGIVLYVLRSFPCDHPSSESFSSSSFSSMPSFALVFLAFLFESFFAFALAFLAFLFESFFAFFLFQPRFSIFSIAFQSFVSIFPNLSNNLWTRSWWCSCFGFWRVSMLAFKFWPKSPSASHFSCFLISSLISWMQEGITSGSFFSPLSQISWTRSKMSTMVMTWLFIQ